MSTEEPSSSELFKLLAPFLAMTAIVAVTVVLVLLKFSPLKSLAIPPTVVSFDVVKYTNSQRAVASAFLKPNADISASNELLLKLPERTREAIARIAGDGTLVVIKQAVVQGQTADITDEVLSALGLPTNVPTADATAYVLNTAPTNLMALTPPRPSTSLAPTGSKQVLP